ncbi:MAG: hypothetical protein PHT19_07600 [Methylococcus sp.]|nr:hypothetical protein [Methylococcus sp.]
MTPTLIISHKNYSSWSLRPRLFGQFSILDAMYAPMALRFHTYRIEAEPAVQEYVDTVLGHPTVAEWIAAGKAEAEVIQAFEE